MGTQQDPVPGGTSGEPERELAAYLEAALEDIRILMEHLGRLDDGRLQAHFDDVRADVAVPYTKRSVPPCTTYRGFLNRLDHIHRTYKGSRGSGSGLAEPTAGALPSPGSPASPPSPASAGADLPGETPAVPKRDEWGSGLSDAAFIMWARDFLAGVVAPTTPDSILLTHAYVDARSSGTWSCFGLFVPRGTGKESLNDRRAAQLACSVSRLNGMLLLVTALAVLISVYAVAGKWIVTGRADAIEKIARINERIMALEVQTHPPSDPRQARSPSPNMLVAIVGQWAASLTPSPAPGVIPICDDVRLVGDDVTDPYRRAPSFGPIPNGVKAVYVSYQAIDLCRQRRRALTQLFAIGEQMLAWQRALTEAPLIGALVGPVFGRSDALTGEMARDALICANFTGRKVAPNIIGHTVEAECKASLQQLVEYYGKIPDAILACITLYILPCLYGFIGAAVATLRRLRSRVDEFLLSPTDRGQILQTGVLGIAAGAIVGLFSAYLTNASGVEGIGLSAIAFLAGYNVSGLFRALDEISTRIFSPPAPPAK